MNESHLSVKISFAEDLEGWLLQWQEIFGESVKTSSTLFLSWGDVIQKVK
jgi:hypothetical protein